MVLSNKKLKQKLRAAIVESLTSPSSSLSATKPDSNDGDTKSTNPDLNTRPQSLTQLLNSVAHKPRLSKREKKRIKTLEGSATLNSKNGGGDGEDKENRGVKQESIGGGGENKENKKRKRDGEKSDEGRNEDLEGADGENKKKKKKKEKKKEGDGEILDREEIGNSKEVKKLKRNKKKKYNNKKKKATIEDDRKGDQVVGNEGPNKENSSHTNGYVATKVYVGGIPYSASEIDIKRYFEECGTITEVDCMTFPDTGKFRGIAIISFRTETAAKRALDLDGSEMDGLLLKIQPYKANKPSKSSTAFAPKLVEGYNRIYIGNLSWDITEEDIRKLFSDCKISSIRFGTHKETGEFKGFAHVDFSDSLSTTMALKLDQEIVCGRPVKISCAVPKKRGNTLVPQASSTPSSNVVMNNDIDIAAADVVPGKIKRRKCYECGEKGHLSSACPNKASDTPISSTS